MFLKEGFYTAMGTPIDAEGKIIESALRKEIEMQIEHGASGLLLMGSMGMEATILGEEAARAAAIAADAVKGRTALFVGIMDNSIARVKARLDAMKGLELTGVVLTAPYYHVCSSGKVLVDYVKAVADYSDWPVYLYDLPSAVKQKMSYDQVVEMAKHPNILGIKTADITMIMKLDYDKSVKPEFTVLYSGLDSMDVGNAHNIRRYLDGMFATTPKNAQAMEECVKKGDKKGATKHLENIIKLRDTMIKYGLWSCFTVTMNEIGLEGGYAPDYEPKASEEAVAEMRKVLKEIGEI